MVLTKDIPFLFGLCEFSSLEITKGRDMSNWILEKSCVLDQKAARKFFGVHAARFDWEDLIVL